MIRKERRKMEQNLGIRKHVKTLPRNERFERIRQNIIEGHNKEKEFKEVVRLQNQGSQDQIDNNKIASLATELMINENMDYADALKRAKESIKSEVSK